MPGGGPTAIGEENMRVRCSDDLRRWDSSHPPASTAVHVVRLPFNHNTYTSAFIQATD